VLYVPVPPNERVDLFLDVAGYIDRRVWASLRVRVDGRETPIVRRPAVGVHERVWCRTATSRPHVKLEILVDRSYSPDELGKGPGDLRKVGLSLRGYGFRVVMPTDRCVEPSANLVEALNAPEGLSSPHPRDH
jgi:hypothetical protein